MIKIPNVMFKKMQKNKKFILICPVLYKTIVLHMIGAVCFCTGNCFLLLANKEIYMCFTFKRVVCCIKAVKPQQLFYDFL